MQALLAQRPLPKCALLALVHCISRVPCMNIGIVGTGNMGRVLGALWAELGHHVVFGARDRSKARAAVTLCESLGLRDRVHEGSNDDAAAFGDLVYYNPRDVAVRDVLSTPRSLDGKIVIDSHNGPLPSPFEFVPVSRSRAEDLQFQIPDALVVKAFNTMAQEVFELCPDRIRPASVSVFLASNSATAMQAVAALVEQMGMVPVDCGPLLAARHLECLGDFIRSLIGARNDLTTTINVHCLPPTFEQRRFGPRSATNLA